MSHRNQASDYPSFGGHEGSRGNSRCATAAFGDSLYALVAIADSCLGHNYSANFPNLIFDFSISLIV